MVRGIIEMVLLLCMSKTSLLDVIKTASKVAVIGASRHPEKVGFQIVKNIQTLGFQGEIFLVNPDAPEILGIQCLTKIKQIPATDIAILAVHSKDTLEAAKEVLRQGTKILIVISSGFREYSKKGALLEDKLRELCQRNNVRLIGPNCMGIVAPHQHLNLSFSSSHIRPGNIAFLSQSGALISALLDWSWPRHLGFSFLASLGNEADVNVNDMLRALKDDDKTEVIAIYAEQIINGREFMEIARQVAKKKKIFLLKGGVTIAGSWVAKSHTGSITRSLDITKALCRATGITFVEDTESFFQSLMLASWIKLPHHPEFFVIGNAGGPGVIVTDNFEKEHVSLFKPEIVPVKWQQKYSHIPWTNPLDLLGDARQERYADAIYLLEREAKNTIMFVVLTPQALTDVNLIAQSIRDFKVLHPKQGIVACFMGGKRVEEGKAILYKEHIPCFDYPELAISLLAKMVKAKEIGETFYKVKKVSRKLADLKLKQIPVTADRVPKLKYPVVLKASTPHSSELYHKASVGAVTLDIRNEEQLARALHDMKKRLKKYTKVQYYVEPFIDPGREILMSVRRDSDFGTILTIGFGGEWVQVLSDKIIMIAPFSQSEVREALKELRGYSALVDQLDITRDIADIAVLLARELEKRKDLELIEINPVRFVGKKVYILDWKEIKQ